MLSAHTCEMCQAVTLRWVLWQNAQGWQRYFCDNDCLVQWIERGLENVCREINLEHQSLGKEHL